MQRRAALLATLGGALAAPARARAQSAWPARPVRLVVPCPSGGSNDLMARILQPRLQQALGRPAQLEHRGGASGGVGMAAVARCSGQGASHSTTSPIAALGAGPDAAAAFLTAEVERWGGLVRAFGITTAG
jgi:tripartite-type tricarboxylate transporter receptor subunit TctC